MAGLTSPEDAAPFLRMEGVHKRFGAVAALSGVDLEIRKAEIHALVGENGAGKSTLMKVLSGAIAPDDGEMELDGQAYRPADPLDARRRGIAMIYQELNLAPHLSVEDNIMLGSEKQRAGFVQRRRARDRVREALTFLGHPEMDPRRSVSELGPGQRQLVEVARALVGDAKVVVMDEPTSSLSRHDTERLFEIIERLGDRGVSVIYISHFLEEVERVADRYTVLRDGQTVASGTVASTPMPRIIEQMVGRSVDEVYPHIPHERGRPVLRLSRLSGTRLPRACDLTLHAGEILGIAGLVGAGRSEMLRAIFGLQPVRAGQVAVAGVADRGRPPHARLAQGIGMLSENRKDEGLSLGRSIAENVTLSRLEPVTRLGFIDGRKRNQAAVRWIDKLGIRCHGPAQSAGELSGGNQQKVAIARLLHHDVEVLLLDEPTRGVDIASKVEIYRLLGELAAQGKALLFVSSYVPELLGVCDRVAVMHRGVLGEAKDVAEWTETSLMEEATQGAQRP